MKKVLSLLICGIMLISVCSAQTFTDMPNNWATTALTNAVDNGLIGGSNGLIRPNDPLTRAEMAAIMVRAFGGQELADLSSFVDVNEKNWFYADMSKAVAMGAFTGDGQYLNPNDNISREQTFAVLARMFSLNYDAEINQVLGRPTSADAVLSQFADAAAVSPWAKELVASVVASGYVGGSDGKINPKNNITRAEFASVMDKLVKTYVDTPGEYTSFPDGSVVIRCQGVTVKNATVKGNLIIGEGAISGADLINANVSERYVARAGQENIIKGGTFGSVRLIRPGVVVSGNKVVREMLYVETDTKYIDNIDLDMGE